MRTRYGKTGWLCAGIVMVLCLAFLLPQMNLFARGKIDTEKPCSLTVKIDSLKSEADHVDWEDLKNAKDGIEVYLYRIAATDSFGGFDPAEDFKKAVKNSEENVISQILASMREYVEERQPIGTFAVLSEAQSQSIGIKATLVVTEGYNESQIKDKVKSATYEFLSKGTFTLNRAFDAIIFERYICLIDGVEYFRVNSITTKGSETSALLVKPDKGKYFELDTTENDKGENPNFVVSIANYGE